VAQLVRYLNSHGIPVWMDHAIHTGDRFGEYIESAIEACAVFIPLITDESRRSDWVRDEIAYARSHNKPILPLRLSGAPPIDLGRYAFEDVSGNRLPQNAFVLQIKQLVDAAKRGEAAPQAATPLPPQTLPPQNLPPPPPPLRAPPAPQAPPVSAPPVHAAPAPAQAWPAAHPVHTGPPVHPAPAPYPMPQPAPAQQPARQPAYYTPAPENSHSSFWGYAIGAGVLVAIILCVFALLFS
jgi:hypothetical protein